ncbi:phage tail tape measure protein, partial [Morganella morganii]
DMLNGNKASWRDWSIDVLKSIQKILVNAAIVNSIKSMAGAGGWIGQIGGFLSGGITANAKGGVYDSPGLSTYSNQVVSSPTLFAFAKGGAPSAGLMGEAGPEAIMPLKRGPDGNLGVRVYGGDGGGTGGFSVSIGDIHFEKTNGGDGSSSDAAGIKQQLKTAVIETISDQAQRPGTPLWNAINGRR